MKATARMPRIEIRKQNTSSNKILPFPWLLPDCYFKKLIQYTELCISRSSWYVRELSWIGIQEDANIKPCQFLPIVISNSVQRIPINQHSFFIQCWKNIYTKEMYTASQGQSLPSRRSCEGRESGTTILNYPLGKKSQKKVFPLACQGEVILQVDFWKCIFYASTNCSFNDVHFKSSWFYLCRAHSPSDYPQIVLNT